MGDLYETLELAPDASAADVRRQYLRLSLKHHPDKNPDRKEEAEAR
jgi:curved DNA-binding protein CbpA